jgi:multisubunit Na+/H+ antiporter MnhC subunit
MGAVEGAKTWLFAQNSIRRTSQRCQMCFLARSQAISVFVKSQSSLIHWLIGLTFFSLSIHLLIAMTDDPERSFWARTASLMSTMVAMVDRRE